MSKKELEIENTEKEENPESVEIQEFEGDAYNKSPEKRKATIITDDEYLKIRVEDQRAWYDRKASLNQMRYKRIKKWEFILAASIPVVISFSAMGVIENTNMITKIIVENGIQKTVSLLSLSGIFQIIAAAAGVLLVIFNKISELENYQKNWLAYRDMAEKLERERLLYVTRTEPYDEANAYPMFVEHIEGLLAKEVQKWKAVPRSQQKNELLNKAQEAINKNLNSKSA